MNLSSRGFIGEQFGQDTTLDILAKNVTAFWPCPKNLLEAKWKSFGLISLAEILRQANIDMVISDPLKQVCNEKEQAMQKEIQNL